MTISKVDGFESQGGHEELYRADEYTIDVVKEFKIELMVTDEMLSQVIETIKKTIKTESIGDEEIFVSSLEKVIRVRTGEHGRDAIS
jgi:nitrogen regulatory protein P-II 1